MKDFISVITKAKEKDSLCIERLIKQYNPLLIKLSIYSEKMDDDLYQYLQMKFIELIYKFEIIQK